MNTAGAREGLPSSPCLNTGDPRAWMLFLSRHGLPSVCVRPQLDLQHKQAAQGTPRTTTRTHTARFERPSEGNLRRPHCGGLRADPSTKHLCHNVIILCEARLPSPYRPSLIAAFFFLRMEKFEFVGFVAAATLKKPPEQVCDALTCLSHPLQVT